MLVHLLYFVVGAIVGGFVVKNNKDKAFAIMDAAKKKAEEELAKLKK